MSETVVVVPDADILASAVAARLVVKIIDAQASRGAANVVLTGGRVAAKVLRAVKELKAAEAIDWSRVDLWWGDERFLPAGDPDRNETQAREALLDALPLDAARVHAMPPSDGPDGDDAQAAAARYAGELATAGAPATALRRADAGRRRGRPCGVPLPGTPGRPGEGTVAAVYNSPKPPPTRISLTMPTIQSAEEVWLIAAGPDKATPVAQALAGADPRQIPAAGAKGTQKTVWLLDTAAAAKR